MELSGNKNTYSLKSDYSLPDWTQTRVSDIVHTSVFPKWFLELVDNGKLATYIQNSNICQCLYAGFGPGTYSLWSNWKEVNISFYENHEWPAAWGILHAALCPSFIGLISNFSSFQSLLRWIHSEDGLYIWIYPERLKDEAHFVATLNHELSHVFTELRIAFDFKNSWKSYQQYLSWMNNTFSVQSGIYRMQFLQEAIAYYEGWASLFRYGNLWDTTMHRYAGAFHNWDDAGIQWAKFGASMLAMRIWWYNLLSSEYWQSQDKSAGFALNLEGNEIFQSGLRKLREVLFMAIYDERLFQELKLFITSNQNPKRTLDYIQKI